MAVSVQLTGALCGPITWVFSPDLARVLATRMMMSEEVPAETVESERRIAEQTAREENKPEAALPKIVEGRVTGFFKDSVLLDQPFAKENKKSVKQVLEEAGVQVRAFARFRVGQS